MSTTGNTDLETRVRVLEEYVLTLEARLKALESKGAVYGQSKASKLDRFDIEKFLAKFRAEPIPCSSDESIKSDG